MGRPPHCSVPSSGASIDACEDSAAPQRRIAWAIAGEFLPALATSIAAEGAASGLLRLGLSLSAAAPLLALTLAWQLVPLRRLLPP